MNIHFDMLTVFMVCSALTVGLSLCMVLVQVAAKPYPGFLHWTVGSMGLGIAFTLFAYPQVFPPMWSMVGGNLCFALFGMLYGRGLRAFAGRPAALLPVYAGLFLVAVISYYFTAVNPLMNWRILLLTIVLQFYYAECIWIVWRDPAFRYSTMRSWLAGIFLLLLVWNFIRLALIFTLEAGVRDHSTPSMVHAVTMVIVTMASIAASIGVIVLNFQRTAASLTKQERRLAFAVSATQDAIWEWNLQTGQNFFSPRWFRMLGLDPGAGGMTVETLRSLCHPDDLAPLIARVQEAVASSEDRTYVAEFRMRHADASWRWIQARGRLVQRAADGQPLILSGINTDITEQLQARERQARLESQLHQAQKMEALGTLAGGIAHDFNNILLGVMGNIQLAAMDLPPGSPTAGLLENAQQASRRARDLIARIMTFSRRHEPNHQPMELAPIIEEVSSLMRATLPAHITLAQKVDPSTPRVNGDPAQLHQVLMNLAVNAAGAIGDQPGQIEISLQHGPPSADQRVRYPDLPAVAQVQLAVRDTGIGMSPEVVERIFEPFYSTKGPDKGSGLGLTMVHRIITDLGGAVTVLSSPGQGTMMTVFLPPAATGAVTNETDQARPVPVLPDGHNILVVDDDTLVLSVTVTALRQTGWNVMAYEHPGQALTVLRKNPHGFSVILTDLTMPHMNGMDLAREIRQINTRVPIVIMTGYLTSQSQMQGTQVADLHFIQKPYELKQLLALLASTLQPATGA